jgi:hypothetical protein
MKGLFKIFPSVGFQEFIAVINLYMDGQLDEEVVFRCLQGMK